MEWTRIGLDGVEKGFADGRREFRPIAREITGLSEMAKGVIRERGLNPPHHQGIDRHKATFNRDGIDPLPDFRAMQAQLDRIEAMLKVLLFHEGIPDIPADRITGIVQGTIQ